MLLPGVRKENPARDGEGALRFLLLGILAYQPARMELGYALTSARRFSRAVSFRRAPSSARMTSVGRFVKLICDDGGSLAASKADELHDVSIHHRYYGTRL